MAWKTRSCDATRHSRPLSTSSPGKPMHDHIQMILDARLVASQVGHGLPTVAHPFTGIRYKYNYDISWPVAITCLSLQWFPTAFGAISWISFKPLDERGSCGFKWVPGSFRNTTGTVPIRIISQHRSLVLTWGAGDRGWGWGGQGGIRVGVGGRQGGQHAQGFQLTLQPCRV